MRAWTCLRVTTPITFALLLLGCGPNDYHKDFMKKANSLKLGMTIAEADSLMRGHKKKEATVNYPADAPSGFGASHTSKPAVFEITYVDKPDANEGDYYVQVQFDKDGTIISKFSDKYLR